MENMFLAIITFFCFAFVVHTYRHLPVKDFRPYAVGNNITEGMKTCDELELPCTEEAYYYVVKNKATGEVSEMLSTDYQDKWEEFDFVEATDKTIVLQEGYEPPINDFSIFKDGLIILFRLMKIMHFYWFVIILTKLFLHKRNQCFLCRLSTAGISFYALCASSDDNILAFAEKKIEYPFILQMKPH